MQQRRIVVIDEDGRDITNQVVVSADSQKGDSHPVENFMPDEADLDDLSSSRAASPAY